MTQGITIQQSGSNHPPQPKPPHGDGNHPACQTPNPPWWCPDAPDATIDMGIGVLILFGIILGLWYLKRRNKK